MNLVKESLNEDMSYKTIFNNEVSHEEALQERFRACLTEIVREEKGISEKAFDAYDDVITDVKNLCEENSEIYERAEEYYQSGKRLNLLAEEIYDQFFKSEDS